MWSFVDNSKDHRKLCSVNNMFVKLGETLFLSSLLGSPLPPLLGNGIEYIMGFIWASSKLKCDKIKSEVFFFKCRIYFGWLSLLVILDHEGINKEIGIRFVPQCIMYLNHSAWDMIIHSYTLVVGGSNFLWSNGNAELWCNYRSGKQEKRRVIKSHCSW